MQRLRCECHLLDKLYLTCGIGFIVSRPSRGLSSHIFLHETLQSANHYSQLMRDGNHTVDQLMSLGKQILGRRHVLPSVTSTFTTLQIEGTFPTGTHLVTVDQPISSEDGNLERALYASFLPVPSNEAFPKWDDSEYEDSKMPGAVVAAKGTVVLNKNRRRVKIKVTNKGDRAIQVCNPALGDVESFSTS